jgi:hypothetical protein
MAVLSSLSLAGRDREPASRHDQAGSNQIGKKPRTDPIVAGSESNREAAQGQADPESDCHEPYREIRQKDWK